MYIISNGAHGTGNRIIQVSLRVSVRGVRCQISSCVTIRVVVFRQNVTLPWENGFHSNPFRKENGLYMPWLLLLLLLLLLVVVVVVVVVVSSIPNLQVYRYLYLPTSLPTGTHIWSH